MFNKNFRQIIISEKEFTYPNEPISLTDYQDAENKVSNRIC